MKRKVKEVDLNIGDDGEGSGSIPLPLLAYGGYWEEARTNAYRQLLILTKHPRRDKILKLLEELKSTIDSGEDETVLNRHALQNLGRTVAVLTEAVENGVRPADLKKLWMIMRAQIRKAEFWAAISTHDMREWYLEEGKSK